MRESVIQCILFVVHGKTTRCFVLVPSTAVEEHSNVCQLFTRNNVEILENGADYPTLYEALERDGVEVLELLVFSTTKEKVFSCASGTTPFIPVSVRQCNQELIRRLLGKDAAVSALPIIDSFADLKGIDNSNSDVIKRVLTLKPDIKYKNPDGGTILHLAVLLQNDTLVELLLNQGVNVDAVDDNGLTPLHLAFKITAINNVECNGKDNLWTIACQLLEKGAAVNAKTKDGSTSLLLAMKNESFFMARLLFRSDADVNIPDNNGLTPLHLGAKSANLEIVDVLLRSNADVNAKASYRHSEVVTPLWVAVECGSSAMVKRLLVNGADPSIPCYDNQTVLKLAVDLERVDIVECILKYHPSLSSKIAKKVICKAVFENERAFDKVSKLLVAHGFRIDVEDGNDTKSLDDALDQEDNVTVRQLFEAGSNVNKIYFYRPERSDYEEGLVTFRKTLPLYTAIDRGMSDVVQLLIHHGVDLQAKLNLTDGEYPALYNAASSWRMDTPLAILAILAEHEQIPPAVADELVKKAIALSSPELLKEAMRKCTRPVCKIHDYIFPYLLYGVRYGDCEIIEILLSSGASIESRHSSSGDTALHCPDEYGTNHREVIKCLVRNTADVEARNFTGMTPLANAVNRSDLDVVVELLKYGACIDVIDDSGGTPLHQAAFLKWVQPIFHALLQFLFTDVTLVQRTDVYKCFNLGYVQSLRGSSGWPKSLYTVFDEDRESLEYYAEVLARHLIRLKAAFPEREIFDFCSKDNLQSLARGEYLMPANRTEEEWLAFRDQCEAEVAQLKSHNIGDSCASYYDVLTESQDEVAAYLRNPVILQALESKSYVTEFPVYAEVLSHQFEKGSLRRELLNQGTKQCHLLVSVFEDLPVRLKEKVLRFLSNRELEVAVHACKCVASRQSD